MTDRLNVLCLKASIMHATALKAGDDFVYSLVIGGKYLLCESVLRQGTGRDGCPQ